MDPDSPTQKLIERTRQRREMLNQRIAVMPEAAPRKRPTPVYEDDQKDAILSEQRNNQEDSPKRQCFRDAEQQIKPDTPAIRGVLSRAKDLAEAVHVRENQENQTSETPVPTPRKSLSSPPLERKTPHIAGGGGAMSSRKGRLAALAQSINDWEDDLTRHAPHKEEVKKPVWQSPVKKAQESGKGPAPPVPSSPLNPATTASPKKTHAPPTPRSPVTPFSRASPARASKVEFNCSPKPFVSSYNSTSTLSSQTVKSLKNVPDVVTEVAVKSMPTLPPASKSATAIVSTIPPDVPVNAPGLLETPPQPDCGNDELELPTLKPVVGKLMPSQGKTPNSRLSLEPSKHPLSAKLARFEKKIVENTPTHGMSSSTRVTRTQKQVCTPALSASTPAPSSSSNAPRKDCDPSELPISQRMSQMQEKLLTTTPGRRKQDEPTAYSVGARMSAWENMSASNMVSDIKKVNPGDATPVTARPPVGKTPASLKPQRSTPIVPVAPKTAPSVAPKKSFKDSIAERASQIVRDKPQVSEGQGAAQLEGSGKSPVKSASGSSQSGNTRGKSPCKVAHSPSKVSSGTKMTQERLLQRCHESNTTGSALAAKIRENRLAELEAVKNRWHNGVLREDDRQSDGNSSESATDRQSESAGNKTLINERREQERNKVRAEFNSKLAEIGLVEPAPSPAQAPAKPPPPSSHTPSQTSSIYNIIKKREELAAGSTGKPSPQKVKFNDSFDDSDDESMRKIPRSASQKAKQGKQQEETAFKKPTSPQKAVKDVPEETSTSDMTDSSVRSSMEIDDDDISLKGFVSEAVRRESILPTCRRQASQSSLDSYEDEQTQSGSEGGGMTSNGEGYKPDDESMDDDEDEDGSANRHAVDDLLDEAMDETAEDYDPDMDPRNVVLRKKRPAVTTAQEEEYDPDMDINNVVLRRKPQQSAAPCLTPRSRPSYMTAVESTDDDTDNDRPYSLDAYRKSVNVMQHQMEPVVRNSKYHGKNIVEENITMPSFSPQPSSSRDERRAVHDRVKELQELVHQEQNVIMQTSNALNKCCIGNAYFAGSSEQVECNRILLIACKKREVYMTEIQRLKETGRLSSDGPGPQGSLTISDIRLPLKKDFVKKIGTSHDNMTHFFIILIRNGSQVICTQMLSSHDPMMRGSLDFPNLIKINGITSNFKLTLDIYTMNILRELSIKDKKKKTPRKTKPGAFPVESPGGPSAVRTTSFSHVTSIHLNMKSLDKTSFHLDRLSHLSPLYGQIFMRIKCLMEASVEERGFLTMFDDVSGFGAWHRRWCVLSGSKLCVWKYPDDESRRDPMAVIDLKRCVTEKVGLIPRDVCARPHTFEMVTVRQPLKGEHDTLVTKTHTTMTTVRHQMSADTKEERIVWCNKINRALANLRTWNADALRPVK